MDQKDAKMKKKMIKRLIMMAAAPAIFAVAFFAKPETVKADWTISGGNVDATGIQGTSGATETLNVTGNATLNMNSDLRFQYLNIDPGVHLTITGTNTLTIDNSANRHPCLCDKAILTIAGGKVQLKGSDAGGYLNVKTLEITGGYVESLNDSCGISADNITISDGTVHLKSPLTAIEARNSISISGGNIEATATTNGSGIYSGGTVDISGRPSVTAVGSSDEYGIRAAGTITISDTAGMGTTTKSENNPEGASPAPGPKESNEDKVEEEHHSGGNDHKPNPLALTLGQTTGLTYGTFFARDEQGPLAKALFAMSMPKGFKHGFYFNMITNNKAERTLKSGSFTMGVPKDLQAAGRTFALLALDKSGKVIVIPNTGKDASKITAVINFEGYAFDLIYKD